MMEAALENGTSEWQKCHKKYNLPYDAIDCKWENLYQDGSLDDLFKCYKKESNNITLEKELCNDAF